jgi:hypothetical protein
MRRGHRLVVLDNQNLGQRLILPRSLNYRCVVPGRPAECEG